MNKQEFERLLKTLEPDAIKALERCMKEGGSNSLKAAELLLAYTQGKPVQSLDMGVGGALMQGASVTINYISAPAQLTIEGEAVPVGG